MFLKFKNYFLQNKVRCLLELSNWILLFLVFTTVNVFSVKLHYLPIILSVLFAMTALVYIFVYGKFHLDFTILFLIVFLLYAVILTLIFSRNFSALKTYITVISISIIIYECIYNSFRPKLFCILFITAVIILAVAFVIYYRNDIIDAIRGKSDDRLGGFFGGINYIANTLLAGIVMCFGFMVTFKKYLFASISALIIFFCILATGSKTPLIGSFISFIVFLFLLLFKKHKWILFLSYLSIFVLLILFFTLPWFSSIRDRILSMILFLSNSYYDASTYNRSVMLVSGLEYWLKNFFFGLGAGGFTYISSYSSYSHSTISEILCDFGIIGSFIYFFPLVYIAFKSKKESTVKIMSVILLFGFVLIGKFGTVILGYKIYYFFLVFIFALFSNKNENIGYINVSFNRKLSNNNRIVIEKRRSSFVSTIKKFEEQDVC